MNNSNKQHYREIDIAKGIAIILVVLGHCLVSTNGKVPSGIPSVISEIIYSFHLPLFFFLSGLLSHKMLDHEGVNENYIIRRLKRLMIPYFVCGLVFFGMKVVSAQIVGENYHFSSLWKIVIGINPYYNLWFLYVLFILSLIGALITRKNNILIIVIVSLVVSIVAGMHIVDGNAVLNAPLKVLKYAFFYYLGMYCGMHYENIKKIFNIKAGLLSMMIFIGGNILSLYMDDGLLNSFLGKIVSLSGIILALTIANLLCKIKLGKAIECFGTNCMGLFVISGFILPVIQIVLKNRLNIGYCFITIIFFVITLLLSLIASILVKKVKILRLLVLGEE